MSTNINMSNIYIPSIQPDLTQHIIHGPTMGTRYSAKFYAAPSIDLAKLQRYLQRAVDNVDAQMSPWKANSDLVRFNHAPVEKWIEIPLEMAVVVNEALHISNLSHGIFNIGVGDLVDQWGFGPSDNSALNGKPPEAPLPNAHDVFELDMEEFKLRRNASMALDLCGIAKGFGVDELARVLINFGIEDFFVSIDGEVKAKGTKPGGMPWLVGIETPEQGLRNAELNLEIGDIAIATSGDYRHYKDFGNEQVSHTMDAKAGKPANNQTTSVTVATKNCISADAWATAFLAMERKEALRLANTRDIDALFYEKHGDKLDKFATGEFIAIAD